MKKIKELLLFLILLVISPVIFFVISGFTADVISDRPSLVGLDNYIRMFLNDKTFSKALFNTVAMPIAISFLFVFVFALIIFFIRKKIKAQRLTFYIGSVFIGTIISLVYMVYSSMALFGVPSQLYAAQTVVSHIEDYSPRIFNAITVANVLISLYVGIFTAFIFWIFELIADIVKKFRRKRDT